MDVNQEVRVAAVQPFQFKTVKELYDAPPEETSFCVNGLLPTSGLSVLAGKPKAGKSTLARQLAVAVAQGSPFLDRDTQQGSVLYLAIEEKQSEVRAHFQQLGLLDTDPVRVLCGAVPKKESLAMLEAALKTIEDVKLVIIDPLFRFVGVKDSNDYIQVNNALEKLMELARNYGVHILLVHHMKKKETEDVADGTLGSTAINAACDTHLSMMSKGAVRTICTRQRYGIDMQPTQLTWNAESKELSLGMACEEAGRQDADETRKRIERDMMTYIKETPNCTSEAILDRVRGNTVTKKRALQSLKDDEYLVRSGGGVKGNPHTYSVRDIPVESIDREIVQ